MLVSAIEVIAGKYLKIPDSEVEYFKNEGYADLAEEILEKGGTELLEKVARVFFDKKTVGKKFRRFIIKFLPSPPTKRPPNDMQVDWEKLKIDMNSNPLMEIDVTP